MGCDIHIAIQCKDPDEVWREVPYQEDYTDIGYKLKDGVPIAPMGLTARCYNLFGILANVRNGIGFAGVETGTGWKSIAPERGLPEPLGELDPPTHEEYEGPEQETDRERWLGDHSFTHIYLDEIENWGWDIEGALLYGVVSADQYEHMKATGITVPDSYCSGVSGGGAFTYEPVEYEIAKSAGKLAKSAYVRVSWMYTAREASYDWPGKVIPWLKELATGRPLRLIIGFDS